MVKFSVIIPSYNGALYLDKAIQSVLKQDYKNYELLLVDDGSTDTTLKIMEKYAKKEKRIKVFSKKNTGIADTRNFAIAISKGEYFLFVDDDDTINPFLLSKLKDEIESTPTIDLIKFQIQKIEDEKKEYVSTPLFTNLKGEDAFKKLILHDLFVTPVTFAYRKEYFIKNKFSYSKGHVHEDFGLTPLLVIQAKSVSAISYIGYNYLIRENSIMTNNSLVRLEEKNRDMFFHFEYLSYEIQKNQDISLESKKIFLSYISNALVSRCVLLNKKMLKAYVKELRARKIYQYFLADTFLRKLKKLAFRLFPMFYVKILYK